MAPGGINLGEAAALRKLRILISEASIAECGKLLATLPAGGLTDLSLVFMTMDVSSGVVWGKFAHISSLDEVLSSPQFASLRRFNVRCQVYRAHMDFTESLECHDRVFRVWLPNVDREKWVDDFGATFDI